MLGVLLDRLTGSGGALKTISKVVDDLHTSEALGFEFILSPGIEWYSKFSGLNLTAPEIQTGPLLAIVTSMLGVAGLRSFEKTKGLTK